MPMKYTDELIDSEMEMMGIKVKPGQTKRKARAQVAIDGRHFIEAREILTGNPWTEFTVDDINWIIVKDPCIVFRNAGIQQLMKKFNKTTDVKHLKIVAKTTVQRLIAYFDDIMSKDESWVKKRERTIFNMETGEEIIGIVLSPHISGLEGLHGLRPQEIDFSDIYTALTDLSSRLLMEEKVIMRPESKLAKPLPGSQLHRWELKEDE